MSELLLLIKLVPKSPNKNDGDTISTFEPVAVKFSVTIFISLPLISTFDAVNSILVPSNFMALVELPTFSCGVVLSTAKKNPASVSVKVSLPTEFIL